MFNLISINKQHSTEEPQEKQLLKEVDLTYTNSLSNSILLPQCLTILNLSGHALTEVPETVRILSNLRELDLSNNKITTFTECPNFYKCIEVLNLAFNNLELLPYWIWSFQTDNLSYIDLSHNNYMFSDKSVFSNGIIKYECQAKYVDLTRCMINSTIDVIKLFPCVTELVLGPTGSSYNMSIYNNFMEEVPYGSLSKCHQIEKLQLNNTKIYTINNNINMFQNLIILDLSNNHISYIPKEFCDLEKLQVCILAWNSILYLPDDFVLLKSLVKLYLSNNRLCMVPDGLLTLPKLRVLDLYDNNIHTIPMDYFKVECVDLAQNFFEEPISEEYIQAKKKLRSNIIPAELDTRIDGIKQVQNEDFSEGYEDSSSLGTNDSPCRNQDAETGNTLNGYSSGEDWDSDSYWEPDMYRPRTPTPPLARWNAFVRQKVREGNFCPFLDHATPIMEQIKNKIKPITYEEGQCDSLTEDEDENQQLT